MSHGLTPTAHIQTAGLNSKQSLIKPTIFDTDCAY